MGLVRVPNRIRNEVIKAYYGRCVLCEKVVESQHHVHHIHEDRYIAIENIRAKKRDWWYYAHPDAVVLLHKECHYFGLHAQKSIRCMWKYLEASPNYPHYSWWGHSLDYRCLFLNDLDFPRDWMEKRFEVYRQHKGRCVKCGRRPNKKWHVHDIAYTGAHLKFSPLENLILLCERCHRLIHKPPPGPRSLRSKLAFLRKGCISPRPRKMELEALRRQRELQALQCQRFDRARTMG